MRWWLMVASLWLLVVLNVQAGDRSRNQDVGNRRGKRKRDGHGLGRTRAGHSRPLKIRLVPGLGIPVEPAENRGNGLFLQPLKKLDEQHARYNVIPGKQGQCSYQGLTMFDQAVWSPKPCVTCLCSAGQVVCDELTCPPVHCLFPFTPTGSCCPVCSDPDPDLSLDLSGDSPVPSDPVTPLTHEEIQRILWREEEEHHEEEERLRRKEEARKKRRKQRKEQEEKQRKMVEARRRQEEEALRLQVEKEEEEWRRKMEEEERKRREEEEDRRKKEAAEREAREMERKLEEERRRQEEL
uniref:VWFC domain-containing protein n=1 Tax=Acanthochromis polyacanthus TaxID=80966 RepID=A0A3Q1G3Q5_9TELE